VKAIVAPTSITEVLVELVDGNHSYPTRKAVVEFSAQFPIKGADEVGY
jgi:hypothetical protein